MEFSDDYIDKLLKQIYSGEINATNLPFGLYRNVCEYLLDGIKIGYDIEVPNQVDIALKDAFSQNINIFSGAKTFQYVLANEGLLLDNEGKLKDWNIFKTESRVLFEKFNKHWLEAEYFTTVGQATEAKKWREFEKHKNEFPLLEYVASIDDKTSPICASKDGIVRRVDDPFWNGNKPLSHYRCRCVLISHAYGDAEITQDISKVIPAEGIFAQDPSKTGQIFDKSHPYFDIAGKYKTFAKTNFNLPIIEL